MCCVLHLSSTGGHRGLIVDVSLLLLRRLFLIAYILWTTHPLWEAPSFVPPSPEGMYELVGRWS